MRGDRLIPLPIYQPILYDRFRSSQGSERGGLTRYITQRAGGSEEGIEKVLGPHEIRHLYTPEEHIKAQYITTGGPVKSTLKNVGQPEYNDIEYPMGKYAMGNNVLDCLREDFVLRKFPYTSRDIMDPQAGMLLYVEFTGKDGIQGSFEPNCYHGLSAMVSMSQRVVPNILATNDSPSALIASKAASSLHIVNQPKGHDHINGLLLEGPHLQGRDSLGYYYQASPVNHPWRCVLDMIEEGHRVHQDRNRLMRINRTKICSSLVLHCRFQMDASIKGFHPDSNTMDAGEYVSGGDGSINVELDRLSIGTLFADDQTRQKSVLWSKLFSDVMRSLDWSAIATEMIQTADNPGFRKELTIAEGEGKRKIRHLLLSGQEDEYLLRKISKVQLMALCEFPVITEETLRKEVEPVESIVSTTSSALSIEGDTMASRGGDSPLGGCERIGHVMITRDRSLRWTLFDKDRRYGGELYQGLKINDPATFSCLYQSMKRRVRIGSASFLDPPTRSTSPPTSKAKTKEIATRSMNRLTAYRADDRFAWTFLTCDIFFVKFLEQYLSRLDGASRDVNSTELGQGGDAVGVVMRSIMMDMGGATASTFSWADGRPRRTRGHGTLPCLAALSIDLQLYHSPHPWNSDHWSSTGGLPVRPNDSNQMVTTVESMLEASMGPSSSREEHATVAPWNSPSANGTDIAKMCLIQSHGTHQSTSSWASPLGPVSVFEILLVSRLISISTNAQMPYIDLEIPLFSPTLAQHVSKWLNTSLDETQLGAGFMTSPESSNGRDGDRLRYFNILKTLVPTELQFPTRTDEAVVVESPSNSLSPIEVPASGVSLATLVRYFGPVVPLSYSSSDCTDLPSCDADMRSDDGVSSSSSSPSISGDLPARVEAHIMRGDPVSALREYVKELTDQWATFERSVLQVVPELLSDEIRQSYEDARLEACVLEGAESADSCPLFSKREGRPIGLDKLHPLSPYHSSLHTSSNALKTLLTWTILASPINRVVFPECALSITTSMGMIATNFRYHQVHQLFRSTTLERRCGQRSSFQKSVHRGMLLVCEKNPEFHNSIASSLPVDIFPIKGPSASSGDPVIRSSYRDDLCWLEHVVGSHTSTIDHVNVRGFSSAAAQHGINTQHHLLSHHASSDNSTVTSQSMEKSGLSASSATPNNHSVRSSIGRCSHNITDTAVKILGSLSNRYAAVVQLLPFESAPKKHLSTSARLTDKAVTTLLNMFAGELFIFGLLKDMNSYQAPSSFYDNPLFAAKLLCLSNPSGGYSDIQADATPSGTSNIIKPSEQKKYDHSSWLAAGVILYGLVEALRYDQTHHLNGFLPNEHRVMADRIGLADTWTNIRLEHTSLAEFTSKITTELFTIFNKFRDRGNPSELIMSSSTISIPKRDCYRFPPLLLLPQFNVAIFGQKSNLQNLVLADQPSVRQKFDSPSSPAHEKQGALTQHGGARHRASIHTNTSKDHTKGSNDGGVHKATEECSCCATAECTIAGALGGGKFDILWLNQEYVQGVRTPSRTAVDSEEKPDDRSSKVWVNHIFTLPPVPGFSVSQFRAPPPLEMLFLHWVRPWAPYRSNHILQHPYIQPQPPHYYLPLVDPLMWQRLTHPPRSGEAFIRTPFVPPSRWNRNADECVFVGRDYTCHPLTLYTLLKLMPDDLFCSLDEHHKLHIPSTQGDSLAVLARGFISQTLDPLVEDLHGVLSKTLGGIGSSVPRHRISVVESIGIMRQCQASLDMHLLQNAVDMLSPHPQLHHLLYRGFLDISTSMTTPVRELPQQLMIKDVTSLNGLLAHTVPQLQDSKLLILSLIKKFLLADAPHGGGQEEVAHRPTTKDEPRKVNVNQVHAYWEAEEADVVYATRHLFRKVVAEIGSVVLRTRSPPRDEPPPSAPRSCATVPCSKGFGRFPGLQLNGPSRLESRGHSVDLPKDTLKHSCIPGVSEFAISAALSLIHRIFYMISAQYYVLLCRLTTCEDPPACSEGDTNGIKDHMTINKDAENTTESKCLEGSGDKSDVAEDIFDDITVVLSPWFLELERSLLRIVEPDELIVDEETEAGLKWLLLAEGAEEQSGVVNCITRMKLIMTGVATIVESLRRMKNEKLMIFARKISSWILVKQCPTDNDLDELLASGTYAPVRAMIELWRMEVARIEHKEHKIRVHRKGVIT
eukprot:GHVH01004609.1.p1 GENE.GHVH01004609.1~~GHVH01004609.1.p1  ORF type:complete len:2157 (-),score=234.50 GHVH01004609.1:82-6552(-)